MVSVTIVYVYTIEIDSPYTGQLPLCYLPYYIANVELDEMALWLGNLPLRVRKRRKLSYKERKRERIKRSERRW